VGYTVEITLNQYAFGKAILELSTPDNRWHQRMNYSLWEIYITVRLGSGLQYVSAYQYKNTVFNQ